MSNFIIFDYISPDHSVYVIQAYDEDKSIYYRQVFYAEKRTKIKCSVEFLNVLTPQDYSQISLRINNYYSLVHVLNDQKAIAVDSVNKLPGMGDKVSYPCNHPTPLPETTLRTVIIHLNDIEKWTRHRIADWLETLDINLEFK